MILAEPVYVTVILASDEDRERMRVDDFLYLRSYVELAGRQFSILGAVPHEWWVEFNVHGLPVMNVQGMLAGDVVSLLRAYDEAEEQLSYLDHHTRDYVRQRLEARKRTKGKDVMQHG